MRAVPVFILIALVVIATAHESKKSHAKRRDVPETKGYPSTQSSQKPCGFKARSCGKSTCRKQTHHKQPALAAPLDVAQYYGANVGRRIGFLRPVCTTGCSCCNKAFDTVCVPERTRCPDYGYQFPDAQGFCAPSLKGGSLQGCVIEQTDCSNNCTAFRRVDPSFDFAGCAFGCVNNFVDCSDAIYAICDDAYFICLTATIPEEDQERCAAVREECEGVCGADFEQCSRNCAPNCLAECTDSCASDPDPEFCTAVCSQDCQFACGTRCLNSVTDCVDFCIFLQDQCLGPTPDCLEARNECLAGFPGVPSPPDFGLDRE